MHEPGLSSAGSADGAYDKLKVYDALCCQRNGAIKIVIPPQKDAALSRARDRAAHLRNENVRTIRRLGRQRWRKESGYFQQGRAENTFFRYKRVFGDCSARHRLRFAETRSAHRLQRLEPDGRAGDAGVLLDQLIGDECGRFSPRSRFMHQRREEVR